MTESATTGPDLTSADPLPTGAGASVSPADYEALYRLLSENAREMVSRHSRELTFLYASPAARAVLGRSAESLIGQRFDDLVHPEDLASLVTAFALAGDGSEDARATFRCRTEDGEWRWCEVFCHGVTGAGLGQIEIHATTRDITQFKQIEKAIERVAREWRSTFDAAHDAILMLDENANILRTNLSTLELFQCEFRDLIGVSVIDVARDLLGLDVEQLGIKSVMQSASAVRNDIRLEKQDRWLRWSIDPIVMADGSLVGMVLILSDITSEKQSQQKLVGTLDELRRLSTHLQDIREHERRSIAREVHDELGHMLTALKMDAAWLFRKLPEDPPEIEQRSQAFLQHIDQTIETTRRIVTSLRPPVLDDLGLDAALDWLISEYRKHDEIDVQLDLTDIPKRLRGKQSVTVFRIVQEALTNIRRHAEATRITLSWKHLGTHHELEIRDNGCGFEPDAFIASGQYGLLGIGERVRSLGGQMKLDSSPGQGACLWVRIPDASLR